MRPLLHATLVNGRTGDPVVFLETMFEKEALLFDLGDIWSLPPRKIHRLSHVFVSHTHIDHFVGFDYMLRVLVGRDKQVNLYGPPGFIEHVGHKLHGYQWNLGASYASDLVLTVKEIDASHTMRAARFRLRNAFRPEVQDESRAPDGIVLKERAYQVSAAVLEHRIPCLAFAVQEAGHVNVWKVRLMEMGLAVGPWLRDLKHAIIEGRSDDHVVSAAAADGERRALPLATLRSAVTLTSGQKIAYVTDAADTPANRAAIIGLARHADLLFIEAPFVAEDAALAAARAHLTTMAAGEIARTARVRRVEPFHFSPRYGGEEQRLIGEVMAAFAGENS